MLPRFFKSILAGTMIGAALLMSSCTKEPVSISVSPSSVELTEGESSRLSASVAPADAKYSSISWSSSNDAVAVVSSDGNANSAANQVNRAFGLNQQGTEIVRPNMYCNKYPWEKVFDLYGVVEGCGAQLPQ